MFRQPAVAALAAAQVGFLVLSAGILLSLSRPTYHALGFGSGTGGRQRHRHFPRRRDRGRHSRRTESQRSVHCRRPNRGRCLFAPRVGEPAVASLEQAPLRRRRPDGRADRRKRAMSCRTSLWRLVVLALAALARARSRRATLRQGRCRRLVRPADPRHGPDCAEPLPSDRRLWRRLRRSNGAEHARAFGSAQSPANTD